MTSPLGLGLGALGLSATAMSSILVAPAAKGPIEFRFDPGDGRSWIETTQVSVTTWPRFEGDRPFEAERVDRLTARRSEQGWEISIEPVSNRSDDHPRAKLDPVVAAFEERLRAVTLDGSGNFVSLRLADGPATETTRVREIVGPGAVDRILATAWRRRGAGLAGHKTAPETNWTESVKIPIESGQTLIYKTRWSVEESVRCGADSCSRVSVQWSAELTPVFMAQQYDVASRWAGAAVNPSGKQRWYVKGKGQLIVQPDGLRVHRIRTQEKLSIQTAWTLAADVFREIVETREMVASSESGPQ